MTSEKTTDAGAPSVSLSRRHALSGAATVGIGVPLLAACGGDDGGSSTGSDGTSSSATSESPASSAATDAPAGGLTTTGEIPVGGGKIFADENVVVVQPTEGEFRGWSATCTHQGCAVAKVADGQIVCPCHNSTFSVEDGSPSGGPATSPLSEVALTVSGESISLG